MRLVLVVLVCGLTACAPTVAVAPSAATAICASAGYSGSLVGAFTVPAAVLAQQDESRGGTNGPHPLRSTFRDYAADAPISLCFFDGFIAAPGGPPGSGAFRPYDRYVVTVDPSGHPVLAAAGHRETIAVEPKLP
jgi:hypothetical protein